MFNMSLEKLEQKATERRNEKVRVDDYIATDTVNILKLNSQIDAVYRLISNTTRRIERKQDVMEAKQNKILELLGNEELDPKQKEIEELENRLKELKGV